MSFYKKMFLCIVLFETSCAPWIDMTGIGPVQPQAEKYTLTGKLVPQNGKDGDSFGTHIAISADGQTVLIGAPGDDERGIEAGAAYLYRWENEQWVETKLLVEDGKTSIFFGWRVALAADGNTALIGTYADDEWGTEAGAVYIYKYRNGSWTGNKVTAEAGLQAGDMFGMGISLSADGNTLLVGAPGTEGRKGCAYLYQWNNTLWVETRLTGFFGLSSGDSFGQGVCLSGDGQTALISAHLSNGFTGCAYIYKWNNSAWEETGLAALHGKEWDLFGWSVALSADSQTALIGAKWRDDQAVNSGAAYVYRWENNNRIERKLLPQDGSADKAYGHSAALTADGNIALVGACNEAANGSAYLYHWLNGRWVEQKLPMPEEIEGDDFGCSVALTADGRTVLIGAYNAESSGAAYLYNPSVK